MLKISEGMSALIKIVRSTTKATGYEEERGNSLSDCVP